MRAIWSAVRFLVSKLWEWPVVVLGATTLYGLGVTALFGDEYVIAAALFFLGVTWITAKTLSWEEVRTHQHPGTVSVVILIVSVIVFSLSLLWERHRLSASKETGQPSEQHPVTEGQDKSGSLGNTTSTPGQPATNLAPAGVKGRAKTPRTTTTAPPPSVAPAPVPEASITFAGFSYGPSDQPPDVNQTLNFSIVGGTAYQVRVVVLESAMSPPFNYPGVDAKFYRLFQRSDAATDARIIPERPAGTSLFTSFPVITRPKSAEKVAPPTVMAFVYVHVSWIDRLKVPGEFTQCFWTQSAQIDAQTKWNFCQIPLHPSAEDLKYEAMTVPELVDSASTMAAQLRADAQADDAAFEELSAPNVDPGAPYEERKRAADKTGEAFGKEMHEAGERFVKKWRASLPPLIEEMMSRIGYAPVGYISRYRSSVDTPNAAYFDGLTKDAKRQEAMMEGIIWMCTDTNLPEHSAMEGYAADVLDYLIEANKGMAGMKEPMQP
jgi:hypothetical protein